MNRFVLFGAAIFFAVVGLALVGGEEKANAGLFGRGCGGCAGVVDCCGPAHCAPVVDDCCGRAKRVKCHGRERCGGLFGGRKNRCCGDVAPACCGEVAPACCAPVAPSCAGDFGPGYGPGAPVGPPPGDVPPPPAPAPAGV